MKLILLTLLLVSILGCGKDDAPAPGESQSTKSTSKKRDMHDFSDRPAPAGVKTGTPGS